MSVQSQHIQPIEYENKTTHHTIEDETNQSSVDRFGLSCDRFRVKL